MTSTALELEHRLVSASGWPGYVGSAACPGNIGLLEDAKWPWGPSCPRAGQRMESL
ncbi:Hypothetical predicted protein [Prunus dulcis]|uniref:Uncharacterized protein n=1 Tax=Prunus dulcis TaxID=3755 RepID=A0A5E4FW36_PRUDU|nr:Hypothetical predicted protein [Prunus dulcis]